jgi:hypothetical protein
VGASASLDASRAFFVFPIFLSKERHVDAPNNDWLSGFDCPSNINDADDAAEHVRLFKIQLDKLGDAVLDVVNRLAR